MPARTSQTDTEEHMEHQSRDASTGPKHLKVLVLDPGGLPEEAQTPFIRNAHLAAQAASNNALSWLFKRNGSLIRQIYLLAERVVREYDTPVKGKHGAASKRIDDGRGQLAELLTTWRVETSHARAQAGVAATDANLLISRYWQAYLRGYSRQRRRRPDLPTADNWRPNIVVMDPIWSNPYSLLLLSSSAQAHIATVDIASIIRRALEITNFPVR